MRTIRLRPTSRCSSARRRCCDATLRLLGRSPFRRPSSTSTSMSTSMWARRGQQRGEAITKTKTPKIWLKWRLRTALARELRCGQAKCMARNFACDSGPKLRPATPNPKQTPKEPKGRLTVLLATFGAKLSTARAKDNANATTTMTTTSVAALTQQHSATEEPRCSHGQTRRLKQRRTLTHTQQQHYTRDGPHHKRLATPNLHPSSSSSSSSLRRPEIARCKELKARMEPQTSPPAAWTSSHQLNRLMLDSTPSIINDNTLTLQQQQQHQQQAQGQSVSPSRPQRFFAAPNAVAALARDTLGPCWLPSNADMACGQQLPAPKVNLDALKASLNPDFWHWDAASTSSSECVLSTNKLEVCFHPDCSRSTSAIRGSEPLLRNGNKYFWQVSLFDKAYGTSIMFGLCTKEQRLHINDYCNLVGLDHNGWSLSHKGKLWHNGHYSQYCPQFPQNQPVTIGMLLDTVRGELSYFLNGENLGVAFHNLNDVRGDLYPVVGSTAKQTRMRIDCAYKGFMSLFMRSSFAVLKNYSEPSELIKSLRDSKVPKHIAEYLTGKADLSEQYRNYLSNNNNNQDHQNHQLNQPQEPKQVDNNHN